MHFLRRVTVVGVPSEAEQHHATCYLQVKAILVVVDEVHHERHTEAGNSRIDDVARSSSYACSQSEPPPFVQCALHTKYAHRPHRRRCNHPYKHALKDEVQYVDWHVKWHSECKVTKKKRANKTIPSFFKKSFLCGKEMFEFLPPLPPPFSSAR